MGFLSQGGDVRGKRQGFTKVTIAHTGINEDGYIEQIPDLFVLFEHDARFAALPQDGLCSCLPCAGVFFECGETGAQETGEGRREGLDGRGEGGGGLMEGDKGRVGGVGEGGEAGGEVVGLRLEGDGLLGELGEGERGEVGEVAPGGGGGEGLLGEDVDEERDIVHGYVSGEPSVEVLAGMIGAAVVSGWVVPVLLPSCHPIPHGQHVPVQTSQGCPRSRRPGSCRPFRTIGLGVQGLVFRTVYAG